MLCELGVYLMHGSVGRRETCAKEIERLFVTLGVKGISDMSDRYSNLLTEPNLTRTDIAPFSKENDMSMTLEIFQLVWLTLNDARSRSLVHCTDRATLLMSFGF